MPLSEYEQQVLAQLERQLEGTDPRLAKKMTNARRPLIRYVVAGLGVAVGLATITIGLFMENWWVGVAGFVVMFAAVVWAFATTPRVRGPIGVVRGEGEVRPNSKGRVMNKFEERWDRRQEKGGF
jgi:hypothetical protein